MSVRKRMSARLSLLSSCLTRFCTRCLCCRVRLFSSSLYLAHKNAIVVALCECSFRSQLAHFCCCTVHNNCTTATCFLCRKNGCCCYAIHSRRKSPKAIWIFVEVVIVGVRDEMSIFSTSDPALSHSAIWILFIFAQKFSLVLLLEN